MLPFKTYSNTDKVELVSDQLGNSLEVPKYGCLTFNEFDALQRLTLESKQRALEDPNFPMSEFERKQVTLLLRLRFQIPEDLSDEEILKLPNGKPFPQPLIDALKTFFEAELRGDPDTEEDGEGDGGKKSIGSASTGSSSSTTPMKSGSVKEILPTSP